MPVKEFFEERKCSRKNRLGVKLYQFRKTFDELSVLINDPPQSLKLDGFSIRPACHALPSLPDGK